MWARNKQTGFTIVELLIVIVIIAILAAITVVAFNGVQTRARETTRMDDVSKIRKALELYRANNDRYPPHTAIGTNAPAGFSGRYGSSYSYSVATNGSWLNNLLSANIVPSVPVDPLNDNDHYYIYWSSGVNGYGACTQPFYVLVAYGLEGGATLPGSRTLTCTMPDGTFPSNWVNSTTQAVFSNTTTP